MSSAPEYTPQPRLRLLTLGNPKTAKGRAKGYAVAVLHLAPGSLSGRNVCGAATAGCLEACLNLAGRGGLASGSVLSHAELTAGTRSNAIQAARLRRTMLLWEDRATFSALLLDDVRAFVAWCATNGLRPVLRLNGTSDLDFDGMMPHAIAQIEALGVMRYDYFKVPSRLKRARATYSLTFSLAENNDAQAASVLRSGGQVAAVFRVKRGQPLPSTFTLDGEAWLVIDGDADDLRFLDPPRVIVGLRAKGPAIRDTSGFVRDVA